MGWLQGGWRKLAIICVLLFGLTIIIHDRQDNFGKLDQFQRRLLACTHYSESLVSQLGVINQYKETVERMMVAERNVSAKTSQAYENKIQFLSAKSDNLQMQLNECQQSVKRPDDISENDVYQKQIKTLERQIEQLKEQLVNRNNVSNTSQAGQVVDALPKVTTLLKGKLPPKIDVNPEEHEDLNIQPVENPNFNPDTEFFFHKKPKEALVFRRGGDNGEEPPAIAELLPHEKLLEKISERKAKKKKMEEENVEDFRELAKPDVEEMDYKEMEQH